ncbi:inc metabolism membrane protein [Malassezia cuniculi]|uniref:Inc metabolism membrane protein n=1 Tax=Malassezia cuniculi TaxID=948313 RepID=A0AAF0EXT5_9BASI|nr:inc metabolism membrane protein [Malassezia cuniculi]
MTGPREAPDKERVPQGVQPPLYTNLQSIMDIMDTAKDRTVPRRRSTAADSVVESLDLSYSLPYSIAQTRWTISERVRELEDTVKTINEKPEAPTLSAPLVAANAELARLRERLDQVQTKIAESSTSDQLRILMADWEHRARTFGAAHFGSLTLHVDSRAYERADVLLSPEGEPIEIPNWAQAFAVGEHAGALTEAVNRGLTTVREHFSSLEEQFENSSELFRTFEGRFTELRAKGEARAAEIMHKATEAVHEVEEMLYRGALDLAAGGKRLITFENLPQVWRNNDCIHTGYRFIPIHNWKLLLQSIFQIHNETVNIQTHLWGLILLIPMYIWFDSRDEYTTKVDLLVQALYVIAAAKCMVCSVSWHVMAGCSDKHWYNCFSCIDYTGISFLVAASLQTLVYNGFYCQPSIVMAYTTGVIALAVTMGIVPWAPWFNDRRYRTLRIMTFVAMAFSGVLPFIHGAFLHGIRGMLNFFYPVFWSVLSYCVGVFLYFNRIPERLAPGRFDYFGHSHQLWHISILVAIWLHYRAVIHFHQNRFEYSCNAHPSSEDFFMPDSWVLSQASRLGGLIFGH